MALVATLVVTPSPAPANSDVVVTGCGYEPNVGVTLVVTSPTAIAWRQGPVADAEGCIDIAWNVYDPGTYLFETYQYLHNDHHAQKMASTELQVI
jgi:hypothetical protein